MKTSTVLRMLLGLEWILSILCIILYYMLRSHLPPELSAWLDGSITRGLTPGVWVIVCLSVPLLILSVVGTVGLFLLQRWGAWLCLSTAIFGIALMSIGPPIVSHAVPNSLNQIAILISGTIIGISFFTDVLKNKDAEQNDMPTQGKHLAIWGLVLQLAFIVGMAFTIYWMIQAFAILPDTCDAHTQDALTPYIANALKVTLIGMAVSFVGDILLCIALFGIKYRAIWFKTAMWIMAVLWLLRSPVGIVLGIVVMFYLSKHKDEFTEQPVAGYRREAAPQSDP
jgi:MotA/TolQ/ExbB proton channel family protein